jgi:hypothetical protein
MITEKELSLIKFIEEMLGLKFGGDNEKDALQFIGTYYRDAIRATIIDDYDEQ